MGHDERGHTHGEGSAPVPFRVVHEVKNPFLPLRARCTTGVDSLRVVMNPEHQIIACCVEYRLSQP